MSGAQQRLDGEELLLADVEVGGSSPAGGISRGKSAALLDDASLLQPLLGGSPSLPSRTPRSAAKLELLESVRLLRELNAGLQARQHGSPVQSFRGVNSTPGSAFRDVNSPTAVSFSTSFSTDVHTISAAAVKAHDVRTNGNQPGTFGLQRQDTSKSRRSYCSETACSDIVQFTSAMYYVEESERKLQIDIMRLGSMEGECSVRFQTEDASAKAGERYRAANGKVSFKDGEHTKSITVNVIENDTWASTLEFKIVLSNPVGCELGQYLYFARVKIIDNDTFPSSVYFDEIEEGYESIQKISGFGLFMEYVKLNLNVPGIMKKSLTILLFDQLKNGYLLLTMYLNIFMVDTLFKVDVDTEKHLWTNYGPEKGRILTAGAVGLCFILPLFFLHAWGCVKVRLDLAGQSGDYLQTNLFRKYLNYSDASRSKVPPAHIQVAITRETEEVVRGFLALLELVLISGKLAVLVLFILRENPNALMPIVGMPTCMAFFAYWRARTGFDFMEVIAHKISQVVAVVNEVVVNYSLIADYQQRPQMCDLFHEKVDELNEAKIPVELYKFNNTMAPQWLGPIFTGFYIVFQAHSVITGIISVGTFLATIKVFQELSEEFKEGYDKVMMINASVVPLRSLTHLFNMQTDLKFRKDVNRKRRELTKMARLEVIHGKASQDPEHNDAMFRTDLIEIKLVGINFSYNKGDAVFANVTLSCKQGELVAVVGAHGSGKSTLLKLLGHNLFPDEGVIFIPTHLRILHVTQRPILLGLTAWRNLIFGRPKADPSRVKAILKELAMVPTLDLIEAELAADAKAKSGTASKKSAFNENLAEEESGGHTEDELEDPEEDTVPWQDTLSSTEIAKIHFARALVMNPEVIVLHRPMMNYDPMTAARLTKALRTHVDNRGFQVPAQFADRRRPRTCFFTPTSLAQTLEANVIWHVETPGVRRIDQDECQKIESFG